MSDHLIAEADRHAMVLPTTQPTHADIAWYVREVSELRAEVEESKARERAAIASWDEERQRALREGGRVVELRAELAMLREWQREVIQNANAHHSEREDAIARAERAEAELKASRYETVKAAQAGLHECIRAERAEAELKAYRDAVDAQPWASDLPIRVLLDQITSELLATRNLLMSDADAQAELAKERARLDWLEKVDPTSPQWDIICDHVNIRAAIDAAMKEGTK